MAANTHPLKEIAQTYVHDVTRRYENEYTFIGPIPNSETGHKYEIQTVDGREVGYCIIYTGNDTIPSQTRAKTEHNRNTISVTWLGINKEFLRKGLGTVLLLYGICDLYIRNPVYTHVTLDDDTSDVHSPLDPNHIYRRLGFELRNGMQELSNNGKTSMGAILGPERITTIAHMIGAIVPKMIRRLETSKKAGGTRHKIRRKYTKKCNNRKKSIRYTSRRK
jgi:GNAT superfamily N-acetyltransferase